MTTFNSIAELRQARDRELKRTDVLMVPDIPLTDEEKTLVKLFRQSLRDFPNSVKEEKLSEAVLPTLTNVRILKYLPE
jgi:hypothetical protein